MDTHSVNDEGTDLIMGGGAPQSGLYNVSYVDKGNELGDLKDVNGVKAVADP